MREIKFRAWDKKTNKMFEIDHLLWDSPKNGISVYVKILQKDGGIYVQYQGDTLSAIELMQFIGLKDKNGKEIYEGDIVKIIQGEIEETIHEVTWGDEWNYPAFDLEPDLDCESNGLQHCIVSGDATIEVIGNIYENPELLKES